MSGAVLLLFGSFGQKGIIEDAVEPIEEGGGVGRALQIDFLILLFVEAAAGFHSVGIESGLRGEHTVFPHFFDQPDGVGCLLIFEGKLNGSKRILHSPTRCEEAEQDRE
jgi:hypothetical protein